MSLTSFSLRALTFWACEKQPTRRYSYKIYAYIRNLSWYHRRILHICYTIHTQCIMPPKKLRRRVPLQPYSVPIKKIYVKRNNLWNMESRGSTMSNCIIESSIQKSTNPAYRYHASKILECRRPYFRRGGPGPDLQRRSLLPLEKAQPTSPKNLEVSLSH